MSRDLIVPVFIDTNSLLDLLASIEGGFSVVEKVTTQNTKSHSGQIEGTVSGGTEFGIPNVLNLLKLNLGVSGSRSSGNERSEHLEAEKYHTYGSLFYRLREYLEDHKLIKRLDRSAESWSNIQVSDFVEIRGVLNPNPILDALETLDQVVTIVELASSLQPSNTAGQAQATQSKRGKKQTGAKSQKAPQDAQLEQIQLFIRGLADSMKTEQIRTFVLNSTEKENMSAVAVLSTDYLRDKTMTEIYQREYFLLGKVVRKVESEDQSEIDLLAGTSLGAIGPTILNQLTDALGSIPDMNLPEIRTSINGPALEVVPIAIFV